MNTQAILKPAQVGIKMIRFPASNFKFQGVSGVRCNRFQMAETPFTNAHFLSLLKQSPDKLAEVIKNPQELLVKSMLVAAVSEEAVNSPLVFVNHTEASGIAALIGCRLPTELEWERAAAGLNGRIYPWGNKEPDASRAVFHPETGTRAVGRLIAGKTPEGLFDLAGNVWEWTSSIWGSINLTNAQNPIFPQSGINIVLRGGSWCNTGPGSLRGAGRSNGLPGSRSSFFGFRVAED